MSSGEESPMLTRDKLTDEQWRAVRNTPHHVVIAVSASGGSAFDEMLERTAGLDSIVNAMHSTHPLLREIASSTQIMQAQGEIRAWYYTVPEGQRTAATLHDRAFESMSQAVAALRGAGGGQDLLHYGEFVVATATRVARAAREGDLFGVGGELVSDGERRFIDRLAALAGHGAG
jgi:hypothetical protein